MEKKRVSRREFLKRSGGGSVALTAAAPSLGFGRSEQEFATLDRHAIFAALGDALIPTDPGDPGYTCDGGEQVYGPGLPACGFGQYCALGCCIVQDPK